MMIVLISLKPYNLTYFITFIAVAIPFDYF